jgi:acetoin utilization protein AcuB
VSDRDLREFTISIWDDADAVGRMREHMQRPISDFMNGDLHMVRPQDDLREAVDLMLEHKIGAVPVVEPATGELVGIISYIDVLRETRDAI